MKRKRDNKTALTHQRLDQLSKTQIASASKFAEGLCLKKLFFVFLIGSVLGSFYEEILHFVQTWYETGVPVWSLRRGVIYGPFNVIYGFGAAAMTFFLVRKPYKWWEIFLYSALLGGVIEYMISWLQEFFTHTRSWDYHDLWLNIDGRTTIPYMLVWGVLGLILVKFFLSFDFASNRSNSGANWRNFVWRFVSLYFARYADFLDSVTSPNFAP